MQVASSFGHAVVFAPDRDVDALFLLLKCTGKKSSNISQTHQVSLDVNTECRTLEKTKQSDLVKADISFYLTADLKSFCHDATHDGTHTQCTLHVQFA